jgi:hypothetical protein
MAMEAMRELAKRARMDGTPGSGGGTVRSARHATSAIASAKISEARTRVRRLREGHWLGGLRIGSATCPRKLALTCQKVANPNV